MSCKQPGNCNDVFWMDDVSVLWQNNNYLKFVPTHNMTRVEQLNAITRLCLYSIILMLLFADNYIWIYLPILIIVLVVILYNVNRMDKDSVMKENDRVLNARAEQETRAEQMERFDMPYDGKKPVITDIDDRYYNIPNSNLQTGQFDSNGILNVGPKVGPQRCNDYNDLLTLDEMINFQKNTCRVPTYNNPAMNLSLLDYNMSNVPVACNADDDEIKDDMQVTFNHDLFRSVDELWERENNNRSFYTLPNHGIPNNMVEWARWLYAKPDSDICKVSPTGGACLQYVNLRDSRDPVPQ